jgi:hypothetical protein
LRENLRKEVEELLKVAEKTKSGRKIRRKYDQTGSVSKRDVNILRATVEEIRNPKEAE